MEKILWHMKNILIYIYLHKKKNDAPYYIVSFDIANSKFLSGEENRRMHKNIDVIVKYVYNKLLEIEKN